MKIALAAAHFHSFEEPLPGHGTQLMKSVSGAATEEQINSPVAFEGRERPLAPAGDLCVDGHRAPVFGTVPADLVFAVYRVDLRRAPRSGEVDQVYVLVSGPDVLKLYPRGAVKLCGVGYVLAPLPHEFGLHARLLQDLAHGRVVGKLVSFYVPARREPSPDLIPIRVINVITY
jgi:hypothetical protein